MVGPAGRIAARECRRGLLEGQSGGPRGAVPSEVWVLPMPGVSRHGQGGGADSARPGTRRMASPSDRRRPRMTRKSAYPPAPLQGLPPGLPRPRSGLDPREMLWARIPARTLRAL